jgi:hypothetical protein
MWLDVLVPRFPLRQFPAMLAIASVGALIASAFGIVHDQLTYTLSPEYFTRLKFQQFAWANTGWPPRVFVGQIGLLASWWVGLIGGWLVARSGAVALPPFDRWQRVARALAIVALVTAGAGLVGWIGGSIVAGNTDLAAWQIARQALGVRDLPSFVTVAYIHNATYIGAALGTLAALIDLRRNIALPPEAPVR